jgi:hypothetical protein
MSTSAILPVSSIDYGSSSATASQQTVFNNVLGRLEQSIGDGDLAGSQTLLNAVEALSPSSAGGSNALGTFLDGVGAALNDGSVSEAQSALAAYQSATASSTPATPTSTSGSSGTSAAGVAAGLVLSQIQLSLVSSLLGGGDSSSSDSSSNTLGSLLNILNAAYGSGSGSGSGSGTGTASGTGSGSAAGETLAVSSSSPYDALVSAIQSSLSAGTSPASTALAYLSPTGNYVDTYA